MNRSQLMGLDSVGINTYNIHGYFRELTVGQRTPGFWGIIGRKRDIMALRQELNQVGEKPLPHGVYRKTRILVSMRSSRHAEEHRLLLQRKPKVRSPSNLERRWSFFLLLLLLLSISFFSFSFSSPLSTGLFGPTSKVGCPIFPRVTLSLALLDFPYPFIHNLGFPSS